MFACADVCIHDIERERERKNVKKKEKLVLFYHLSPLRTGTHSLQFLHLKCSKFKMFIFAIQFSQYIH